MTDFLLYSGLTLVSLAVVGSLLRAVWLRRKKRRTPEQELQQAKDLFEQQRLLLQSQFFEQATRRGVPRDLIWTRIDWSETTSFARDLQSHLLTAFVGIEVAFEAVPGGDMEEVEAVSQIRQASALFHYRENRWGTGGKALFNMTPDDAVERLIGQFEPVDIRY